MARRYSFQDIRVKKEDGDKDQKNKGKGEPKGKKPVEGVRPPDSKSAPSAKEKSPEGEPVAVSINKEKEPKDSLPRAEEKTSFSSYKGPGGDRKAGMSRGARMTLWALAGITVIFLGVSIASIFSSAKVVVTPETATASVDLTVTATLGGGTIPFEVEKLVREETKSIPATQQEAVSRRASGEITIYNEYTTATQRLIRNTRFESPDGKVYRILESVEVPGLTREGDTVIPGTLEATVYADEPGEEYNRGPVERFTLPGLAGGPRFSSVYAQSETPLEGGFIGTVRVAPEEEVDETIDQLRTRIGERLVKQVRDRENTDTVFYPDSGFIVYDEPDVPSENQDPTVAITQKGTLHAVLFDREALTQAIADHAISDYDGAPVSIENIEDLTLEISNRDEMQIPEDELEVTITGQAQITWQVDREELRDTVAGVRQSNFQQVISSFPHIENAEAVIRPFWQRSFPEDAEDITIELSN